MRASVQDDAIPANKRKLFRFLFKIRNSGSVFAPEGIHLAAVALCWPAGSCLALPGRWRRCRLLGRWRRRQILVKRARLFIGPAPCSERHDFQNQDLALKRDGQNVAGFDGLAGRGNLVLVDADVAGCRQLLRKGARFRDPGVPEPLVDPQDARVRRVLAARGNYFLSLLSISALRAIRAANGELGSIGLSFGGALRRFPPSKPLFPPRLRFGPPLPPPPLPWRLSA